MRWTKNGIEFSNEDTKWGRVWFPAEGEAFPDGELCLEDWALGIMLLDKRTSSTLFVMSGGSFFKNEEAAEVSVNCNDVFYYGADSEPVSSEELGDLYRHVYNEDGSVSMYGAVIWVAKKRNQPPLYRTIERMKEAGVWEDDFDEWGTEVEKQDA